MTTTRYTILQLTILTTILTNTTSAWPKLEIESREYKVLLTTSHFATTSKSRNNETAASDYISQALSDLEEYLVHAALKVGAKVYGTFQPKIGTPRYVRYYDVPGRCHLREGGYILNLRREIKDGDVDGIQGYKEEDAGKSTSMAATKEAAVEKAWEGTLKSRSGDRYFTTYKSFNMNTCCKKCKDLGEKLEEDVTLNWNNLYSYSKRCKIKNEKYLQNLSDVAYHWKDMDAVIASESNWDTEDALMIVGGLTVVEHVYSGLEMDFDDGDRDDVGKFSVTLWYDTDDGHDILESEPKVAELSFRIKSTGKKLEDWRRNTIMKAHAFWEECADLPWVDVSSETKTAWIYGYEPEWCFIEKEEEESSLSSADR